MERTYLITTARDDADSIHEASYAAMKESKKFMWLPAEHPFVELVQMTYRSMESSTKRLPAPNKQGGVKIPTSELFILARELLGFSEESTDEALGEVDEHVERVKNEKKDGHNVDEVLKLCPPDVIAQVRGMIPEIRAMAEEAVTVNENENGEGGEHKKEGFLTLPVAHPVAVLFAAKLQVDSKSRLVVQKGKTVRIPATIVLVLMNALEIDEKDEKDDGSELL